jgi:hypothetical protein
MAGKFPRRLPTPTSLVILDLPCGRLLFSRYVVERGRGVRGRESVGMRPDPGFQGFSLCSSTAIVLPPLSSLLVTWGKLGRGGSGETSPRPGCLPASFPAPSVTSSSSW